MISNNVLFPGDDEYEEEKRMESLGELECLGFAYDKTAFLFDLDDRMIVENVAWKRKVPFSDIREMKLSEVVDGSMEDDLIGVAGVCFDEGLEADLIGVAGVYLDEGLEADIEEYFDYSRVKIFSLHQA